MAEKSIGKNYIFNLCNQCLTILTPVITTPYLSRVLGPDGVGQYSYIEAIASYFVLFATLGLTTFGQREISYVQEDRQSRSIIFWETNIIGLISSILCIVVYIIFSLTRSNWQLYIVLVFNLFAVIADITWFYQGMEDFGSIALKNIAFKLLSILFVFLCIKSQDDLVLYLLGTSLITFFTNVSYWFSIHRYVDFVELRNLHPGRHLKTVLSLFLPTIAIQVYTVLDKTMIGVITKDAYENGYYEQAVKIARVSMTLVTSLGTVMVPRIGYHFEKNETEQVKQYMYRGYRFVWFLGIPLCFGLCCIASNFVPWFFGEGYDKVVPLIAILSFLILAIGINNVTGVQYLIPTKRQNIFTRTVVYGAIVNFILNLVLITKFQSFGAAAASVIAETVIAVIQLIIVKDELSYWIIIKSGKNYFIAGLIMAGVLLLVRNFFVSSIINTAILIVIGMTVYLLVLLAVHDNFFLDNAKRILKSTVCKTKN